MAKRDWTIYAQDFETEDQFRDAVARSLMECEPIGHRLGGAIVAAPIRQVIEDEFGNAVGFYNAGWSFRHENAPAVRSRRQEQPAPAEEPHETEPELDPEPALAEAA